MNREIKFRAFDKEKKEMCPVVRLTWPIPETPDLSEIMQFTGLLDSKGKEIYEGDIVRICRYANQPDYEMIIGPVEFYEGTFVVGLIHHSQEEIGGYYGLLNDYTDGWEIFEVIGNIHEHPELLVNHGL